MSNAPTNRLATANGNYGALSWTYDGVGNRTGQTLKAVAAPYAYPTTNNRLSTIGGTTRTFTYDGVGNTLTDTRSGTAYVYTYNNANRLKTVTVAGNLKATYTYDAMQHLAIRVLTNMTPSGTIHSVYDRDGNLLSESNGIQRPCHRHHAGVRLAAGGTNRPDHGRAGRRAEADRGSGRGQHGQPADVVGEHRPPEPPGAHDRRGEGGRLASNMEAIRRAAGDHGNRDTRCALPRPVVPARERAGGQLVAAL